MADLDGDGQLDMISGAYWPGDITWFRGEGRGRFAKGAILKAKDGANVNAGPPWKSKNKPEMDSLAAAPWLVDWEGDGDLDLLVGNIAGRVVLIANEGDAKAAQWVRKGPIEAGGKVLDAGHNDAGPTAADWDGDGLWDLLVGSGDGSVTYFRNTGTKTAPKLASGVLLIAPQQGYESLKSTDTPARPGSRTKPHVCDYDGDGRLDLLVGDYNSISLPEPVLTAEQVVRRDELQARSDELGRRFQKIYESVDGELERLTSETRKEYDELSKQRSELYEQLKPLVAGRQSSGWVWVYLRKAPG